VRQVEPTHTSLCLLADDYEIYEALRRVHLLPENLDDAELKGNAFASLETFVAVGKCIIT
jgi:hypothetical protein